MSAPRNHLVVMKFGGTSVEDATAIQRTASIVAGRAQRGLNPVVVVSAMAKVTDQLLACSAAAYAGRGDKDVALEISAPPPHPPHRHSLAARHRRPSGRAPRLRSTVTSTHSTNCCTASRRWANSPPAPTIWSSVSASACRPSWSPPPLPNADGRRPHRRPPLHHHRQPPRQGRAQRAGHRNGADRPVLPLADENKIPSWAASSAPTPKGNHHTGTRRLRLHRRARRRRPARRRHRNLDRCQRHHDHRSAHLPRRSARKDHQLRRGRRARLLRRESPASRNHPSGGAEEHPGVGAQQPQRRQRRHKNHRRARPAPARSSASPRKRSSPSSTSSPAACCWRTASSRPSSTSSTSTSARSTWFRPRKFRSPSRSTPTIRSPPSARNCARSPT